MQEEIWKPVLNYEQYYAISNLGRLKSLPNRSGKSSRKKEYILRSFPNTCGYLQYTLYKDNKKSTVRIHRLVAEAFIHNSENKRTVNHINGIKIDNRVENLEWLSDKENIRHGWATGLYKFSKEAHEKAINKLRKPVYQFDKKGILICIHESLRECARSTGINKVRIFKCCHNKRLFDGDYIFSFYDTIEEKKIKTLYISEQIIRELHPEYDTWDMSYKINALNKYKSIIHEKLNSIKTTCLI